MTVPLEWQTDLPDVPVPDWLVRLAGGRPVHPVWRNEDGGLTWRIGAGEQYVKLQEPGPDWDPDGECHRLGWVGQYMPAPALIDRGRHGSLHWLRTRGLPGRSAVAQPWRGRPDVAVPELGRALRRFHDGVPVDGCPFEWSVAGRVARFGLASSFLDRIPPLDEVVCHGDACNPNFLLDETGRFCGYVDLGSLGVADRWADLAPALMSLDWNYGPSWQPIFLDAYGIAPDPAKQSYYTALWDGVADMLDRRPATTRE